MNFCSRISRGSRFQKLSDSPEYRASKRRVDEIKADRERLAFLRLLTAPALLDLEKGQLAARAVILQRASRNRYHTALTPWERKLVAAIKFKTLYGRTL